MGLKRWIPPAFIGAAKRLRSIRARDYRIGEVDIHLPAGHTLPRFQAQDKLYDRFLPVLAAHMPTDKLLIDVGANVGDSLAMMVSQNTASMVAIEGSAHYFEYLKQNIQRLPQDRQDRIRALCTLVGTGQVGGELSHTGGTASVRPGSSDASTHQRLDALVTEPVSLIKVDTDGFDYDVLLSATALLQAHEPALFWENQVDTLDQQAGYDTMYASLEQLGYDQLYVIDNHGNVLLEKVDFHALRSINQYLMNMQHHGATRTFYYVDVLATTATYREAADRAMATYRRDCIEA